MQLYFQPLACSMATRISLAEANIDATFTEVDPVAKRTMDGDDYLAINPLGLVPALRIADDVVITENVAVLEHVARESGDRLRPRDALGQLRMQQWLGFISSELHTGLFSPFFSRNAPEGTRAWTLESSRPRLDYLNRHLDGREFLLDSFTVADAYLVTVLNWAQATPLKLADWPHIERYLLRHLDRPSVKRAIATELPLYFAEQKRRKAAEAAQ